MKDYSKSQLASALARHFQRAAEDDATIPEELRKRANAWLPDAMRFPAVTEGADLPWQEGEAETDGTDADETGGDPTPAVSGEGETTQVAA